MSGLKAFFLLAFCAVALAFVTNVKTHKGVRELNMIVMKDNRDMPGATAPFGYFDPLGLSTNLDSKTLKRWREAELKHGRLAMLAALGMLVQESFHPVFPSITGPAIYHYQQAQELFPPLTVILLSFISVVELVNISKGWESADEKTTASAMLKKDYIPGDLGFGNLCFI